jgi:hypothetical protein
LRCSRRAWAVICGWARVREARTVFGSYMRTPAEDSSSVRRTAT